MPIYEYRCRRCGRRTSLLLLSYKERAEPICPRCGSKDLARIMSRFATVRSEESRLEAMADDPSLAGVDENDPRSVARFMKKMGREFGDELGDDFAAAVEEAEEAEAAEEPPPADEGGPGD